MKFRSLFACVVAFVMVLVGCEQETDFVLPKLKLETNEITFNMKGGDTTVTVTSTRDWVVEIDEESAKWIVVSPAEGRASATPQEVIVAVLANEGYDREATVSFATGLQIRHLTVKQDGALGAPVVTDGDGTKANPYSASKAQEVAAALGQDDKVTGVYAKGVVKSVKEISTDFGNATYYLTDEDGKAEFYVYRGRGLGNTQFTSTDGLKAGDKVVIYGDLMNYMGSSPQFGQGNYIVELNGVANDPNGNNTPGGDNTGDDNTGGTVPPAGGDVTGTSLTVSRDTMTGFEWTENSYGSQNISDLSTYLSWTINGASFIGAKMCIPGEAAFADFAIQCQGSDSEAAKQARFGNTSSLGKITKITVVSHNLKYTPNFNLAIGTEPVVGVAVPSSMTNAANMTTTQEGTTYTTVYTPATEAGYFAIYNSTVGALYFSEVIVEYTTE